MCSLVRPGVVEFCKWNYAFSLTTLQSVSQFLEVAAFHKVFASTFMLPLPSRLYNKIRTHMVISLGWFTTQFISFRINFYLVTFLCVVGSVPALVTIKKLHYLLYLCKVHYTLFYFIIINKHLLSPLFFFCGNSFHPESHKISSNRWFSFSVYWHW